jgi:hypothetical protein
LVYVPGSLLYALVGLPYSSVVLLLNIIPFAILGVRHARTQEFIDVQLGEHFESVKALTVLSKTFPVYRFVDILRAVEKVVAGSTLVKRIQSEHGEQLDTVLSGTFYTEQQRRVTPAKLIAKKIDLEREEYFPSDCFWIIDHATAGRLLLRVRFSAYDQSTCLELASATTDTAQSVLEEIVELAAKESIYRNRTLEVYFEAEVKDSDGDTTSPARVDLLFKKEEHVVDGDIILDDGVRQVLERNVVDYHRRRQLLRQVGLPGKKAVLLFGPPGTGKTHTCRYLATRLAPITTLIVAGHALLHVRSVCNIARMLQPSLIVLEDVDLVFTDRNITPFSTVLGELMDQLDGFERGDELLFVLTTNSIERIESAIKDRPGRVSQCIFIAPPPPKLRKRYLQSLLQPFDCDKLDFDRLVNKTEGATQAFIQELVRRAVQVATESLQEAPKRLSLVDEDFKVALLEMTSSGGKAGSSIVGFRANGEQRAN